MRRLHQLIIGALICAAAGGMSSAALAQAPAAPAEQCAPQTGNNAVAAARAGVFRYLRMADEATYLGDLPFEMADGKPATLADYRGKTVLLNLWGVWCPPCRREISDLSALQAAHGGDDFTVLTVSDFMSGKDKVQAFLAEQKAQNLPMNHDAGGAMQQALAARGLLRGLPDSLIIDKKGCLIASLQGGAPWGNADAWHFIETAQKAQE